MEERWVCTGSRDELPAWVGGMLGGARPDALDAPPGLRAEHTHANGLELITVVIEDAVDLAPLDLQRRTIAACELVRDHLRGSAAPFAIRFWNHIPSIGSAMSSELDRYMVFNAGRFAAMADWYGSDDSFRRLVATASGVGHFGRHLSIHCLAAATHGIAVENPRQVPAYEYSPRYGPMPPSFARATIVTDPGSDLPRMFVGGTASVCGEISKHHGDLEAQLDETHRNIDALLDAGHGALLADLGDGSSSIDAPVFEHLRIYFVRAGDRDRIATRVAAHFAGDAGVPDMEFRQAQLCRSDLLVEIEGVAVLGHCALGDGVLMTNGAAAPAVALHLGAEGP